MAENIDYEKFMGKAMFEKALNTLIGIVDGISADNKINADEINELKHWCLLQYPHRHRNPFNEILEIVESSLEDEVLTEEEIDEIKFVANNFLHDDQYHNVVTHGLQKLQGMLHGILSDNEINAEELKALKDWLDDNDELQSYYPYDEIYTLVREVLLDQKVDENEAKLLKAYFSDFIDSRASLNISEVEVQLIKSELKLEGICSFAPDITIENKMFCYTGKSDSGLTRDEIANEIINRGGKFHKGVTKETNFLVVGGDGNSCWKFSTYGTKVDAAMKLRKKGSNVVIVNEIDFWDAMND
jgi:NAD-dependent DNA ligase